MGTIVGVAVGILGVLLIVGAVLWYKYRKEEMLAKIKQNMLDRGISAEEITLAREGGAGKKCGGRGSLLPHPTHRPHTGQPNTIGLWRQITPVRSTSTTK